MNTSSAGVRAQEVPFLAQNKMNMM